MKEIKKRFALCVDNADYGVSLIPGKVYRVIPDQKAARDDFVRIIDESGEDYLYHKSHFVFVNFPKTVERKLIELEASNKQPIIHETRPHL
ncbi:MAG: hypothetical protein KAW12_13365 [Candidatus Aminicenantes bacterium]|nr:hypothetical protein [Candidatus Aminicenantes bacterium]